LDEPSTGMDPATKRKMWEVINSSTKDKNSCVLKQLILSKKLKLYHKN